MSCEGSRGGVLGKVDFMVEEGGLRGCGRYDRDLRSISIQYALFW
jgi:hypothetical protein